MATIKELLRSVFVELLTIAIVTFVSLLLLKIGIGKIVRKLIRFLAASKSGMGPLYLFASQLECKDEIIENFKIARRIKILTARGGRYLSIEEGWFYKLLGQKKGRNDQIQVLVCSSDSPHIDEELAQRLTYPSAEAVRARMRTHLMLLGNLSRDFPNILVRVYAEKPIWNILLFDDVMYVAPYVEHKSHKKATVFKFQRHDRSHFVGFESHFDRLWFRSRPLEEFLADLGSHV